MALVYEARSLNGRIQPTPPDQEHILEITSRPVAPKLHPGVHLVSKRPDSHRAIALFNQRVSGTLLKQSGTDDLSAFRLVSCSCQNNPGNRSKAGNQFETVSHGLANHGCGSLISSCPGQATPLPCASRESAGTGSPAVPLLPVRFVDYPLAEFLQFAAVANGL